MLLPQYMTLQVKTPQRLLLEYHMKIHGTDIQVFLVLVPIYLLTIPNLQCEISTT